MSIFVVTEVMFFVALVTAYTVIRSTKGDWVPPADIRLPVLATGFNTLILFLSGVFLFQSGQALSNGQKERSSTLLLRAMICGICFVSIQGYEWVQLVTEGMTMKSSIFGACFYLLIGSHGLHALGGAIFLFYAWRLLRQDRLLLEYHRAVQVFWFFIVGVWPVLYGLVYF